MGPGDRAQDVVGVLHVGDPVANVMSLVLSYKCYVTHDHGEGVGPGDRAEDVVGVLHVGDPLADVMSPLLRHSHRVTRVTSLTIMGKGWGPATEPRM